MYMGVVGKSPEGEILRELAGSRVLVTGLSRDTGVDVARAFADVGCRLVVQTSDLTPDMTALVALLSQTAAEMKLYTDPIARADAAVRFAQNAQQAFGGLTPSSICNRFHGTRWQQLPAKPTSSTWQNASWRR